MALITAPLESAGEAASKAFQRRCSSTESFDQELAHRALGLRSALCHRFQHLGLARVLLDLLLGLKLFHLGLEFSLWDRFHYYFNLFNRYWAI